MIVSPWVKESFYRGLRPNCRYPGCCFLSSAYPCLVGTPSPAHVSTCLPACPGLEVPPFFDEHPGAASPDSEGKLLPVCLVDHNEDKQMVPSLRDAPDRKKRIIGLIDHHVTRLAMHVTIVMLSVWMTGT